MYDEKYKWAKKKVKRKKDFYIHTVVFIFGSVFLFLINLTLIYTWEPWFVVPVSVWGLALFIHGIFAFTGLGSKEWMERQIEKEMKKMDGSDVGPIETFDDDALPLRPIQKETNKLEDEDFV